MLDYKLLQALAMVIQEGGFDKAARHLGLTQSAVSQRIKLLEDQMGHLLVTRTNPPGATAPGKALLKHYIQVQNLEADLETFLTIPDSPENRVLSVGINADSLATWFLPAVRGFLDSHPVVLDLKVDDQDETHQLLRDGEVAGCISSEKTAVQGCRVAFIGTMYYDLVASPDFARRYFPQGVTPDHAAQAPAVIFNRKDDLHHRYFRSLWGRGGIPPFPIHYVPSSEAFVDMVVHGLAYGMVPRHQARADLESGALIPLSPEGSLGVDLYWHRWNLSSALLDEFSRAIVENAVIC